jgi:hypothetical protein
MLLILLFGPFRPVFVKYFPKLTLGISIFFSIKAKKIKLANFNRFFVKFNHLFLLIIKSF